MKRIALWTAAAAFAAIATSAIAQAPGGGGGFTPTPEMAAKFKKWQAWRENHKNFEHIQSTVRGLAECVKDPATSLTKDQAKAILAVYKKWGTKAVMSNDDAGAANKALTSSLNIAQIKKIATTKNPFAGGGRMGGGGGGRPGGGGGAGGARPGGGRPGGGFTLPDPKDYNPLNPDTLPFEGFKAIAKQSQTEFLGKVQAAAK